MIDYPDYRYSYVVHHEAWYAAAADAATGDGRREELQISRDHKGGGAAWEFTAERVDLGGRQLVRLKIFEDAFDAFGDAADFFAALRSERPSRLSEVRSLLDRMGFVDRTERQEPRRNPLAGHPVNTGRQS